ncbi:hypothetical protein QFZ77_005800 [Paenibacillus sp. V4I3]|nr:hypothetical protein [Paenibacillus sp. V4I3]
MRYLDEKHPKSVPLIRFQAPISQNNESTFCLLVAGWFLSAEKTKK